MADYITVRKEACDEFVEKRSRFIGYIKNVETTEDAMSFIDEIRKKHWDATHNVYAYNLRRDNIRRYSDDGEPSGTAGVPALDVLLKQNIVDCAVVAVRYFGGVLLGAGGLVRAYSHTAKIAVDAAGIKRMSLCAAMSLECDYNFYGKLTAVLEQNEAVVENADFGENVTVVFHTPVQTENFLNDKIFDASFGKYRAKKTGEVYAEIK